MLHNRLKCKSPKTFFSDNCIRNIFAKKRLWSFSTNNNENEVCTKKSIEYLRKLTHILLRI